MVPSGFANPEHNQITQATSVLTGCCVCGWHACVVTLLCCANVVLYPQALSGVQERQGTSMPRRCCS
jgi:hypothetical protein